MKVLIDYQFSKEIYTGDLKPDVEIPDSDYQTVEDYLADIKSYEPKPVLKKAFFNPDYIPDPDINKPLREVKKIESLRIRTEKIKKEISERKGVILPISYRFTVDDFIAIGAGCFVKGLKDAGDLSTYTDQELLDKSIEITKETFKEWFNFKGDNNG